MTKELMLSNLWCLRRLLGVPRTAIKPDNPKGNQPWIFTERTDAEAEAPTLWPLNVKNWLTGKDFNAGKDWWQEEKGKTENKMVGWHHMSSSKLREIVKDKEAGHVSVHGVAKKQTWLSDWTTTTKLLSEGLGSQLGLPDFQLKLCVLPHCYIMDYMFYILCKTLPMCKAHWWI